MQTLRGRKVSALKGQAPYKKIYFSLKRSDSEKVSALRFVFIRNQISVQTEAAWGLSKSVRITSFGVRNT